MKILIFCLTFFLFYSQSLFAQTCRELFTLSSNQYSLKKHDFIVDSEFGVLKIVSADFQNDVLEVVRLDPDKARQVGGYNSRQSIKIAPFIKRKFAKIPSKESSLIVKDRVSSTYSFAALKYYFALYRIIDLLAGNKSNFKLKEQFRDQLSSETLNTWTFKVFERKLPKGLDDLIAQIESVTGENLVQSGILSTLALRSKWKSDRLAWPASAGKKANVFQRADGRRQNVELSIEMDIDHFARTYLWKNSLSAPLPIISIEQFVISLQPNINVDIKSLGKVFIVEQDSELSQTVKFDFTPLKFSNNQKWIYSDYAPYWRELLQVAESPINLKNVNGQKTMFFISKRVPNIDAVAAHLRQLAWINGATSISQIIVE
jgi:hypothetical protein